MTTHPPAGQAGRVESMDDTRAPYPAVYRIRVRGRLTDRMAAAFPGMALEERDGATDIVGPVRDPSHLYGLLDRLRDLGVQITRLESRPTTTGHTDAGEDRSP